DHTKAAKHSKGGNQNSILSSWKTVGETAVWLRRTCSRARTRECKSGRRIFAGGKSYQSFRSISHIPGSAAEDRLDDDGGILSRSGARISFTRDRCVLGGAGSR